MPQIILTNYIDFVDAVSDGTLLVSSGPSDDSPSGRKEILSIKAWWIYRQLIHVGLWEGPHGAQGFFCFQGSKSDKYVYRASDPRALIN